MYCLQASSVQTGTVCPSIRVRWFLNGVVLHCQQGSEQVSLLWPVCEQFEHLISKHFGAIAPLSRRCSSLFCFWTIWVSASSFLWQVARKYSFVIISLYFSRPCWVKGSILPWTRINSPTWLAIACMYGAMLCWWNRVMHEFLALVSNFDTYVILAYLFRTFAKGSI